MQLLRFEVHGYKNFTRPVVLEGLGPINILHGDNNIGKSNLLEAMHLFFRVLSKAGSGDRLPFRPADVSAEDFLAKTGHDAAFIFNLESAIPITLAGRLSVEPSELDQANIQPLCDTSRVDIALKLERIRGRVSYVIEQFRFADGLDAGARMAADKRRFVLNFAVFLARNLLVQDRDERPSFALIEETRRIKSPGGSESQEDGGIIPQGLMRELYKARDSLDNVRVRNWELFAELAVASFPQLTEGEFTTRFDIEQGRADLIWTSHGRRMPVHLLGSGLQQGLALLGQLLTTDARWVALEEPECNLRYELQLRLRQAFQKIVADTRGPSQLFMTSHSPAFELGDGFYGVRLQDGAPIVERRPKEQARAFLGIDAEAPPEDGSAPLSYVTSDGLVRVPSAIRDHLGVGSGGSVVFIERDSGEVELLSSADFLRLLDPDEAEGDDP